MPHLYAPVVPCASLSAGMERAWQAHLFDETSDASSLKHLLDPQENNPASVLSIWLGTEIASGADVAVAVISRAEIDTGELPVLSLYVHPDHREKGLGGELLAAVLKEYRPGDLAAHYTTNAVRLYAEHGFVPANIEWTREVDEAFSRGGQFLANACFINAVLEERKAFDASVRRHRLGGPRK